MNSAAASVVVAQNLGVRRLAIFAAIEGAPLVARSRDNVTVYEGIVETYRSAGVLP